MGIILIIAVFLVCILQIVLIIKIWSMTNDVSKIRELLQYTFNINEYQFKSKQKRDRQNIESGDTDLLKRISADLKLYGWVRIIVSQEEFQVMEIYPDGTFLGANAKYPDGIHITTKDYEIVDGE